ncbi:diacylglycerol/polyprenol kinase family protein [Neomegalonema perideroedes]|uniref:hypothetical protein n=1 Tax=Neomegalonema perideroedes TaxID=217219 RepID=UPI0003717EC2|nr:hypothetical protein [Neomegalonema perideroedes]
MTPETALALRHIGLVLSFILALLGVLGFARWLAEKEGLGPEGQRKLAHMAAGLSALALPVLFKEPWPVMLLMGLSLLVLGVLRLPALRRTGLGAALHGVERQSYGEIWLILAVGFLFLRSGGEPILYVLPLLLLALADAAAALVGSAYGRSRFAVASGEKSLEGVAAFFIVAFLVSMIALLLLTDIPRPAVILLGLMTAAFAALVEADSWRGLDNLFVPVGAHFLLASYLDAPLAELAAMAGVFLIALWAALRLAPKLGLSDHAARAATVLIFLVCAVTQAQNALLPALAILAHLAARRTRPDSSAFPDLDFLAATALVSLLWLGVGEGFGPTAINLYGLTFAGIAAAHLALALPRRRRWIWIPAAAVLGGLVWLVARGNLHSPDWGGGFAPWIAVSLILASLGPLWRPESYETWRRAKIFAAALIVPAGLYAAWHLMRGGLAA